MKILFLIPRYHTNIIHTINSHIKLGHTVEMHVKNYGFIEDHTNLKPIKFEESYITKIIKLVFNFKTINNSFYLPKLFKYFYYLRNNKFDFAIIRIHGFIYTYIISCILKLCKINIIYYQQANLDLSFLENDNLYFNLRKFEFHLRLKIFNAKWVTPLKYENFKHNITKKLYFLPFVVQLNKFNLNFSELKIITIGKFVERKNHIFLLESILDLIHSHNIKITIVGELSNTQHKAYYKKLIKFVEKNDLKNNVLIKKNIDHEKIYSLYKENNLFVLPSTNEPAAISLLEAMGCGLISICSDTCGTRTYIKDGYNGYIFKNNDKFDLRKKILIILENLKRLKIMSSNSFNFARDNISFESYKEHFEDVIKK